MIFDWDTENILHIARHNVTPNEVEEVFDKPTLDVRLNSVSGEDRFTEIGVTRKGRFLEITTILRGDAIRVVTAYDAPKSGIQRVS